VNRHPLWAHPALTGVGLAALLVLLALNLEAFYFGIHAPRLLASVVFADLVVVGTGILAATQVLRADRISDEARHAVDESEARVSAIVESAMDAVITVDETQRIVLFNRAAELTFRCSREDALGSPLERFLPERFRAAHAEHVRRFGRDRVTSRRMGDVTTLTGLRADGEEFPIEASIAHAELDGHPLYTVILRDVTLRKQQEQALARQQEELRDLSAQVLEAREEEKTLIARELHDELGQLLTALKMDVAWLRDRLPPQSPELGDKARQMGALLDQTVASVRRISADLRPLMLDDLGLADAAGWLVEDFARRSGIECRIDLAPREALDALERNVAVTLYRVLQESLTNVARHAGARRVWASLALDEREVRLEVEDDGRGIAPEEMTKSRSLGLKGMRERVRYLGGSFEAVRAARGGTRVRVSLPVTGAPARAAEAA
jgi:PAS domain S-box-containing protein